MYSNPFNFGKIAKNRDFYNRKDEIDMAIEYTKNLQCFSVVGERRIGKTSFLEHILSEDILKEHEIDTEEHVIVHLEISSPYGVTKDALIGSIVEKIRETTQIEVESKMIYKKFEIYVDILAEDRKNLIIALDEFECIEPILDDDFSHWLKLMFEKKNVMAITASRTTIKEMGCDSKPSPLYGIFTNIFLGLFEQNETERMFSEMFLKCGMNLNTEIISFLVNLSGGNPYLIQFLGFNYYERRRRDREVNRNVFEDDMSFYLKEIFEGYWEHLGKEERKLIFKIIGSGKYPFLAFSLFDALGNNTFIQTLEKKGFLIKEGWKWKIFSPLFEKFIMIKRKEFKNSGKKRRIKLSTWVLLLISLAGFSIGIRLVMTAIGKLQEFDPSSIFDFAFNLDFLVGVCSLIFTILSFIATIISIRKFRKEIN